MTKVIAVEVESYRNLEPKSMLEETKDNIKAPWTKNIGEPDHDAPREDDQEPAESGQDLTFIAQFAQGALINTAGSPNDAKGGGVSGNVEFNGLPATSNGYSLDGHDTNDPWLGLKSGLSTNLVIGLDAIQDLT